MLLTNSVSLYLRMFWVFLPISRIFFLDIKIWGDSFSTFEKHYASSFWHLWFLLRNYCHSFTSVGQELFLSLLSRFLLAFNFQKFDCVSICLFLSCWGFPSLLKVQVYILPKLGKFFFFFFFFFETVFRSCYPGWSAMAQCRLTATSASWVQAILLPQPPEQLGLHARATMPR